MSGPHVFWFLDLQCILKVLGRLEFFHISKNVNQHMPPEWRSGLGHGIMMLEVSLQTRVWSRAVSQLAVTLKRQVIGPALSGLGEGLAGWDFLVPSRRAGHLRADFGHQLDSVSSDTLVQLSSELSERCVKKQCSSAGSMALDLRLSRVFRGVVAMGKDSRPIGYNK
jgi:hypothetical protein